MFEPWPLAIAISFTFIAYYELYSLGKEMSVIGKCIFESKHIYYYQESNKSTMNLIMLRKENAILAGWLGCLTFTKN